MNMPTAVAIHNLIGINQHTPIIHGVFRSRPNRFLVRCAIYGREIDAFMPNPGRMGEILLPGAKLILMDHGRSIRRKTRYTVMAAHVRGQVVFLHTHKSNLVARWLVDTGRIPALADYRVVRAEVPHGRSRFDFLLDGPEGPLLLEVKSCTLVANGLAMFPDAVTKRGRRHMIELAAINAQGHRAAVLFLIHNASAGYFLPDYHTDINFGETFKNIETILPVYAVAIDWRLDLTIEEHVETVTIPWDVIRREVVDKGNVIILGEKTGSFTVSLTDYSGASSDCLRRIETAARKAGSYSVKMIFPVRSSKDQTAKMLHALEALYGQLHYGSIHEGCLKTYIFNTRDDPARQRAYQDLILYFRMSPSLLDSCTTDG